METAMQDHDAKILENEAGLFGNHFDIAPSDFELFSQIKKVTEIIFLSYIESHSSYIPRMSRIASKRIFLHIDSCPPKNMQTYPMFRYLAVGEPHKVSLSFQFTYQRMIVRNKESKPSGFKHYYNLHLAREGYWYLQDDFSFLCQTLSSRGYLPLIFTKIQQKAMELL
jgi:hypothetical protein